MRFVALAAVVCLASACAAQNSNKVPAKNSGSPAPSSAPYKVKVNVAKNARGDWECRAERRDKSTVTAYRIVAVPGEQTRQINVLGNREDDVSVRIDGDTVVCSSSFKEGNWLVLGSASTQEN